MLLIERVNWNVVGLSETEAEFSTKLKNLSDAQVYDYTEAIETAKFRVMYDGHIFKVINYGVTQDYMSGESRFYIDAKPARKHKA